jgi:hypothetical protein
MLRVVVGAKDIGLKFKNTTDFYIKGYFRWSEITIIITIIHLNQLFYLWNEYK